MIHKASNYEVDRVIPNCYVAEHFLKLELYHTNREFYFLKLLFAGRIYLLVVLGQVFYLFLLNVSIVVNEQKPLMVTTPTLCAHTCTCATLVPRARRGICANAYEKNNCIVAAAEEILKFPLILLPRLL